MSQYFRNKMLWNPGYTGVDGNKIYALQNRSWTGFEGAPVMTSVTGEIQFGKNSAIGFQVLSDISGVLNRTYGLINYAYRMQLGTKEFLRLGIALSYNSDRLNNKLMDGITNDPAIFSNLQRSNQFDGNFGAVYTRGALDLGVSFYRIGSYLRQDNGGVANQAVAQLGIGYNMNISENNYFKLKPLAMFRLYKETLSVLDVGVEMSYDDLLQVMLLYQSTGNIRSGLGLRKTGLGEANFFYNTNTKVANNAGQQYELGLVFYIKKQD